MFEKHIIVINIIITKYNLCLMNDQVKSFTNNKVYFILILMLLFAFQKYRSLSKKQVFYK